MVFEKVAKISQYRQDGVIRNDYMFCFNSEGRCTVYSLSDIENPKIREPEALSEFCFQNKDLVPHSNAVVFGNEYYSPEDEFPLLYANIYNNYMNSHNQMRGTCCVYRLQRKDTEFWTELVQIIEIGFTDNEEYWCSPDRSDVRPYGNFVVDRENSILYAFTMIDKLKITRYFSFDLPKLCAGAKDEKYGVNRVVLQVEDIKGYFDCSYQNYMQGACLHKGKIYSLEGFSNNPDALPVMRIVDVNLKKEVAAVNLTDYGLFIEPEMIDFCGDKCYYMDDSGEIYKVTFNIGDGAAFV